MSWLPRKTLHEIREIKRCAALAAKRKPFIFAPYSHARGTDPIAHADRETLITLKRAISALLISHGALIRSLLALHCGSVALELIAPLPGWDESDPLAQAIETAPLSAADFARYLPAAIPSAMDTTRTPRGSSPAPRRFHPGPPAGRELAGIAA